MSLIGDEQVISLQRTKIYVFSDSVLCLGKIFENTQSNDAWEERLGWFKHLRNTETLTESTVSQWTSSGIFPRINMLQLNDEVKSFLLRLGETPENFTGRIIFMTMFNENNEKECLSNANLVTQCAKRFGRGQRTFIGPGSEKKVVLYQ